MTWARGQYQQTRRGGVYVRHLDATSPVPSLVLAGGFLAIILALLTAVASDHITLAGPHEATLAAIAVPALAGLMVFTIYGLQLRADRRRLLHAAFESCAVQPPTDEDLAQLAEMRAAVEPMNTALIAELERAYVQLIHMIVADGVAEAHELERLARTEAALNLPASRISAARLQGFLDVYDRAIEDDILTEEEEASIQHIREALEVPVREVRRELVFTRQLARARSVRDEPLVRVPVSARLHGSEQAFYTTMGTHKVPVMRTYRRSGQTQRERVFEPKRAGNLIVTNERLLFEAGPTLSIGLQRIVEASVDATSKYLMIHDDRHKEPYFFDVPQPYMALAYVERVLEGTVVTRPFVATPEKLAEPPHTEP